MILPQAIANKPQSTQLLALLVLALSTTYCGGSSGSGASPNGGATSAATGGHGAHGAGAGTGNTGGSAGGSENSEGLGTGGLVSAGGSMSAGGLRGVGGSSGNGLDGGTVDASGDAAALDAATSVTLRVTVPENTPDTDFVSVYFLGGIRRSMSNVAPQTWELHVTQDDVGPGTICYHYTRNNTDYLGAEYLEPDTSNDFFSGCARSFVFSPGTTVTDTVTRWRWFPPDGTAPTALPISSIPTVVARDNGQPLRIGVALQDLYLASFDALFAPTAARVASLGLGMVDIEPAWHALSLDPVPVLGPDYANQPDYTDDALRAQIDANVGAGLVVMVSPQVDPMVDFTGTFSTEWWDAWFEQYGTFLATEAQIAETEGATEFAFRPDGIAAENPPADADARWRALLAQVRAVFTGRIGLRLIAFSPSSVFPDLGSITFPDAIDFVLVQAAGPLSTDPAADDAALLSGAGGLMDVAEPLGLPVTVEGVYASVNQSWRGTDYYSVSLANAAWGGESDWQAGQYTFDEVAQARVENALLSAIATRPWVESYLAWGYWNQDMPRAPGFSVRAKVGERLLEFWAQNL
jgi:Glycoside Hydrolase Family 113